MTIEADFTQPNIIYSEKKIYFKYFWERNVPIIPLEKELALTSGSSLPLNFTLKLSPPFAVSEDTHSLEPSATTKINATFDPNFKIDKTSGTINGKINVIYTDHPYRETVELVGELCFPNLKMEASIINFGAILNDTTKKISMLMKNISLMNVTYEWAFLEEEIIGEEEKMNISSNSMFPGSVPINEVFDILPLSGVLEPGQVEEVEFIYNAQGGILYRATAICHVEGGPNY
jgi:hydrocephalus-inducing protein